MHPFRVNEKKPPASESEKFSEELNAAREIQQSFLPEVPSTVGSFEFEAFNEPAGAVGGDFYDFFPIDETHFGIVLGDVTGKGLPAAMLMTMACQVIRTEAANILSPAKLLEKVNKILYSSLPKNKFVAVSYAVLDMGTKQVVLANAGQITPYLLKVDERKVEALDIGGMPLGILEDVTYREITIGLIDRYKLFFTSDGTVEALNPQNEIYGFDRFETDLYVLMKERCQPMVKKIIKRIKLHSSGMPLADDITMFVVGVT